MGAPDITAAAAFYGGWLLVNSAAACAEYDFLSRFIPAQVRRKWHLLLYLCANSVLLLLTIPHVPSLLREIMHTALLCVFLCAVRKVRWADAVAPVAIVFTLSTFLEGISAVVMRFLAANLKSPQLGTVLQMLLSVLMTVLLFAAFCFIAKRYGDAAAKALTSYLYLLLLPCAFVVWVIRFGLGLDIELLFPSAAPLAASPPLWAAACIAGALVTFFVILEIFSKIVALADQETEQILLAAQLREQRVYLSEAAKRADQYRAFQHDINNHLLILSGLLQAEKYGEVREYLTKLNAVSHTLIAPVSTGNSVLDVLLSEKIRYAGQSGIAISHRVCLPQDLMVDDIDLCIVIANAMDNAIRACTQEPEENRRIHIAAKIKHQFLLIEVTNPCQTAAPVRHGTGLKNIARIAGKYHGAVEIEQSDSHFRLSVLLCREAGGDAPLA